MTAPKPRQAIIYCRISDDREGREYGVERQEAHCRKLAARRGWHVAAVLVDNDITGTGRKQRPGYDRLLDMLRDGTANAILAVSDKRLNRSYRNAFALLDLIQERDIAVEFTKGGPINMNTAEGRGIARRKAIDAQEESEEIGERVADAKADNVKRGEFRGGGRPFGFEADGITPRSLVCPECEATEGFVITVVREDHDEHPDHDDNPCPIAAVTVACPNGCDAESANAPGSEAWYLEAATRAVADGASNRSELRKWHEAGVRTPARRKRLADGTRTEPMPGVWSPTTFLKLLRRPRNAGLLEVAGEAVGKGAWPAIVDESTWRKCQAVLKDPSRRTSPGPTRKYLGGGLYLCGICSAPVTTTGRGRNRNGSVYTCGDGQHISRSASAVDQYVAGEVIELITRRIQGDSTEPNDQLPTVPPELLAEHARLRKRLRAVRAAFADSDDDPAELKLATDGLKKKIKAVEKKIADATPSAEEVAVRSVLKSEELISAEDVAAAWEDWDMDTRRAMIADVATVTILPGTGGRPKDHKPGQPYFRTDSVRVEPKPTALRPQVPKPDWTAAFAARQTE